MKFLCPTCKLDKYLEVYPSVHEGKYTCYCRHCEEGCVPPLIVPDDGAVQVLVSNLPPMKKCKLTRRAPKGPLLVSKIKTWKPTYAWAVCRGFPHWKTRKEAQMSAEVCNVPHVHRIALVDITDKEALIEMVANELASRASMLHTTVEDRYMTAARLVLRELGLLK